MKSTTFLFILLFSLPLFNLHAVDYDQDGGDSFIFTCYAPLDFTQPRNVHYFLRNVFNDKRYAYDFLPYNISFHLMQFLQYGKASKQKALYIESTLRLFYNKLKTSSFVCNKTFSEMLDRVPPIIKSYCPDTIPTSFFTDIEHKMMDIFVPTFLQQFAFFKKDPEDFLKNLAHDITLMIQKNFDVHDHVASEQLKQMFVRFMELSLMKLMWHPEDQNEVWSSVKKISAQLYDILELGIITVDELDDLYKSLLESFCRFLELAGSELSNPLIDTMKEDLYSGSIAMFELEEQEPLLETKRDRLFALLLEVQARIEARNRGIITDVVVY